MPRLYVSPATFQLFPVSFAFAGRVAQLAAISGALDMLLAAASKRVDGFCHRKIGAFPATTIATGGGIGVGATSVNLTSTLGYGNGQEEAVLLNPGAGNQEIIPLAPGGVNVTSWTSPYPGSIQLAQATAFSHSAGETVQGLYQEVSTVGSSSSSDLASDTLLQLNQAAQIAAAHAPQFEMSGLVRRILLKHYPIGQLYKLEHMLPIDTAYESLDASQVGIHPSAGYIILPLGSFVLTEGLFRSTYTAGYTYIPDDVERATAMYAADELQMIQSQGARQMQQGKLRGVYRDSASIKSDFVLAAEDILNNGGYVRKT